MLALDVERASGWTEAVFHVLAHVPIGRVAASCHDERWIAFAEERFGPMRERALAEDVVVLSQSLADHDLLASAHGVAWIWSWLPKARAASTQDLDALSPDDVDDVRALALARKSGAASEVLRAAAELELRHVASLEPIADSSLVEVRAAVEAIAPAAPKDAALSIALVRPLPRRGRVFGGKIYVGAPNVAGGEASHVAWQILHEASVVEATRVLGSAAFVEVERRAIGVLRSRARAAGLAASHDRWLATLDLGGLGAIPDVEDGA